MIKGSRIVLNIEQLLTWVSKEIHGEYKSNVVVHTPWSLVIKVEIDQSCYYVT
jgi:hypothetical protein